MVQKTVGAFLFSGPSAYIPSQAAYKKEDRGNTHNLTKSGPSVLFHGLVSPIRSLLKGAFAIIRCLFSKSSHYPLFLNSPKSFSGNQRVKEISPRLAITMKGE